MVQESREDMEHTHLRIGVQGGGVEHRGETEVKVVQKEESDGGGKNSVLVSHPPTRIDRPAEPRRL